MRTIIGLLIFLCLASCKQDTSELDSRVEYWNHSLSRELPLGSSTEQIKHWAKSHKVEFLFLPEQHQFYANVERVPVKGIRFPCGEWNIIIQVTVDSSGHSAKNEIHQVGGCV